VLPHKEISRSGSRREEGATLPASQGADLRRGEKAHSIVFWRPRGTLISSIYIGQEGRRGSRIQKSIDTDSRGRLKPLLSRNARRATQYVSSNGIRGSFRCTQANRKRKPGRPGTGKREKKTYTYRGPSGIASTSPLRKVRRPGGKIPLSLLEWGGIHCRVHKRTVCLDARRDKFSEDTISSSLSYVLEGRRIGVRKVEAEARISCSQSRLRCGGKPFNATPRGHSS